VSFTGSTEIGRRIMEMAARDLKRVSLELGGKSPNIVFADADWKRAAETSPMSVFANTGQDCCARSRMFVERSVFEPFVEKFVAATEKLVVGDPTRRRHAARPARELRRSTRSGRGIPRRRPCPGSRFAMRR
jgi:acyl-CoA reductase-like NAD-dependent aldehyde dehydrogenase